ncbi:integrase catalytic domain-containing protein [Trichonephila clavipes]|nr:integrase catalytic domain-containing protein [Trichonephila clavipes]
MKLTEKLISENHRDEFSATSGKPSISPSPLRLTSMHFSDIIPASEKKSNPTRQCSRDCAPVIEIPEISQCCDNKFKNDVEIKSKERRAYLGCCGNGGLEIPSKAKIIDLKKLIESSAVYKNDIEFVRSLVENALEKKKAFQIKSVPDELKAEILLNILGERVNNLLTYVSQEDLSNYVKIKELILREFEPTPQECLKNFKKARKLPSENYVQFASRLSATFDYYCVCQLRKVNEFHSLCDLIISDKIFETLDRDTMNHIATKQGETYFKPQQLGRECDVYLSARGKVSNDLMSRNPGSGVKTDGRNRLQTVSTWRQERNSSNVFVAKTKTNCVLCKGNNFHPLSKCYQFKKLSVEDRVEVVKRNNLCFRCFLPHRLKECRSEKNCFCLRPHNSLIHFSRDKTRNPTPTSNLNLDAPTFVPGKIEGSVEANSQSQFVATGYRIDMLLGAEIFYELLKPGKFYCDNSHLVLQNTVFGYVVSGSVDHTQVTENRVHCGLIVDDDLNKTLKKFWEIEGVHIEPKVDTEVSLCEDHFVRTHRRNCEGEVKEDVFETISRFRRHKFAFTTDIQKMYRQILINPDQQDLQRIIWKHGPDAEILTYRLKTVTYGLSNAPFLAIRTLQQLAKDEKSRFPLASETLLYDIYLMIL